MTLQEIAEDFLLHIDHFEKVHGVKVEGFPYEGELLELTRDGDRILVYYSFSSKKWEVVG